MFFVPAIGVVTLLVIVVVALIILGALGTGGYGYRSRRGPYDDGAL